MLNQQKFWSMVNKDDCPCWTWTGPMGGSRRQYGVFWPGIVRKTWFAHRYSYELHKGPIPRGLRVSHACNTPNCVNPNHLELQTPRDNMLKAHGRIKKKRWFDAVTRYQQSQG